MHDCLSLLVTVRFRKFGQLEKLLHCLALVLLLQKLLPPGGKPVRFASEHGSIVFCGNTGSLQEGRNARLLPRLGIARPDEARHPFVEDTRRVGRDVEVGRLDKNGLCRHVFQQLLPGPEVLVGEQFCRTLGLNLRVVLQSAVLILVVDAQLFEEIKQRVVDDLDRLDVLVYQGDCVLRELPPRLVDESGVLVFERRRRRFGRHLAQPVDELAERHGAAAVDLVDKRLESTPRVPELRHSQRLFCGCDELVVAVLPQRRVEGFELVQPALKQVDLERLGVLHPFDQILSFAVHLLLRPQHRLPLLRLLDELGVLQPDLERGRHHVVHLRRRVAGADERFGHRGFQESPILQLVVVGLLVFSAESAHPSEAVFQLAIQSWFAIVGIEKFEEGTPEFLSCLGARIKDAREKRDEALQVVVVVGIFESGDCIEHRGVVPHAKQLDNVRVWEVPRNVVVVDARLEVVSRSLRKSTELVPLLLPLHPNRNFRLDLEVCDALVQ